MFPSRGQLNLEFLLAVLVALLVFSALFSLYTSKSIELRQASFGKEAALAAQLLSSAINRLAAAGSLQSAEILLPQGSYSISIKGKRVEAVSAAGSEHSYPLIAASASLASTAKGGDRLLLKKENGAIYVSKIQ